MCVTWLIHMLCVTCVWHDSFICCLHKYSKKTSCVYVTHTHRICSWRRYSLHIHIYVILMYVHVYIYTHTHTHVETHAPEHTPPHLQLQHTATQCNTLQNTATHCNTIIYTCVHYSTYLCIQYIIMHTSAYVYTTDSMCMGHMCSVYMYMHM